MANQIQNLLIGILLFSVIMQLSYSFIVESGAQTTTDLSSYVVSSNVESAVSSYQDTVKSGGFSLVNTLEVFFNGAWSVIMSMFDTISILGIIFSSITNVLNFPNILYSMLLSIIGIIVIFTIIRAITKQGEI